MDQHKETTEVGKESYRKTGLNSVQKYWLVQFSEKETHSVGISSLKELSAKS